MSTESQSGTYKRSTPEDVAYVVKEMRSHHGWKQLALAHEAGINVKTIERIEAGERVSDESLQKVAKALKLKEDAFTQANYCPSHAEMAEMVRKAKEDYTHTPLRDLSSATDLENVFSAQAHLIDDTALDDSLADSIAWVKDYVQDAGDIYDDVPHTDRLTFCRELLETLREIETHGYTARWGRYATADDFQVAVLAFFKTAELETNEHFRIALVPRRLFSKAGIGR